MNGILAYGDLLRKIPAATSNIYKKHQCGKSKSNKHGQTRHFLGVELPVFRLGH